MRVCKLLKKLSVKLKWIRLAFKTIFSSKRKKHASSFFIVVAKAAIWRIYGSPFYTPSRGKDQRADLNHKFQPVLGQALGKLFPGYWRLYQQQQQQHSL